MMFRRRLLWIAAPWVAAGCITHPTERPTESLAKLRAAVEARDSTTAERYVDVQAVATSLVDAALRWMPEGAFLVRLPPEDSIRVRLHENAVKLVRRSLGFGATSAADTGATDASPIVAGVEHLGDTEVGFRRDTAVVERRVRWIDLDTVVVMAIILAPAERDHWRIVRFANLDSIGEALQARRATLLVRANETFVTAFDSAVASTITVSREPLRELDRYEAYARIGLRNRSTHRVRLDRLLLAGPPTPGHAEPSILVVRSDSVALSPGEAVVVEYHGALGTAAPARYALVETPTRFRLVCDRLEIEGSVPLDYYATWSDYRRVAPRPHPPGAGTILASVVRP
jgi:hypothetical protein